MSDNTCHSILLVEDDDVLRSVIRVNLVKRGWLVREAATLQAAGLALTDGAPDLLILDLNLPDGSGRDLLRDLHGSGLVVATIVISAGAVTTLRLAETGPVWFLPKPFRIEALLDLIQLARRGMGAAGYAPHPNPLPWGEGKGSLDLPAWTRELRTACITLSRASVRSIRSMTLRLRVTAGAEPSPTDLARRLAAEYGLTCWSELGDGVLKIQLHRDDGFPTLPTRDGDERGSPVELPRARSTPTNSWEESPKR